MSTVTTVSTRSIVTIEDDEAASAEETFTATTYNYSPVLGFTVPIGGEDHGRNLRQRMVECERWFTQYRDRDVQGCGQRQPLSYVDMG